MIAGRYELEREVGRGGMGAVWLARDEVLGRQVALKRVGMMPGGATPDLERAEREARLAARLNHPHVVAVFDLVSDDSGQWLVMEYVEGATLAGLVDRDGALDPDQASPLLEQVVDALAAAHEAGIVHRDVKPSNILVTPEGQVKLSDFGIARAEADASLTQTGLVTGSPAYLAPEVASGQAATDVSDVWSLGATLFHALSGHPPYDVGDNLMGALYRIVHEEPPRLPDAGWLGPLLEATMTRDSADRWSMAQVHAYLIAGPEGTVIHPRPTVEPAPSVESSRAVAGVPPVDSTQVLTTAPSPETTPETTPATPVSAAVLPPAAAPLPASEQKKDSGPRTSTLFIGAGVIALIVLLFVAWSLYSSERSTVDPTNEPSSPTQQKTGRAEQTDGAEPSEPDMEAFIADYLATAPTSPATAFESLTPAFQAASGGPGGYTGFWNTIQSAELLDVAADPEALTVSYKVAYTKTDGSEVTDDVVLGLVFRKNSGRYLIAEEN